MSSRTNLTPRSIAIISAFFSVLITLIFSAIIFRFTHLSQNIGVAIVFIGSFVLSFFLLYFLVNTFIYNRIKIIYKIIQDFKISKKKTSSALFDNRMIDDVEHAAEQFVTEKQQEIIHLKGMENFRKDFLGNVAHELKTPLTAIQGYTLTLLDGGLEDSTINRLYLQRTASNIDRMLEIVKDLDTITQLESESNPLHLERFNIYSLVKEVVDDLEITAKKHQVELVLRASSERNYYVFADKDNIRQVLVNLIENSIKYNDKDYGKTTIDFYDMDKNYLIEVADNGIGIDRDCLPRLFERFYRVDKNRSRTTGGSGLGLAIVKHIIDAHQQSLTVNSTVGEGSIFSFTLQKA